jgi:hypothetical protein
MARLMASGPRHQATWWFVVSERNRRLTVAHSTELPGWSKPRALWAQDDRLDALAGAVAYWTAHLARDTHRAALEHKDKVLEAELEKFVKHALGNQGGPQRRMASSLGRRMSKLH